VAVKGCYLGGKEDKKERRMKEKVRNKETKRERTIMEKEREKKM
jgi:hypothetical protein